MKVNINNIGGEKVRSNDIYELFDNNSLNDLILSSTKLKPKKQTTGHSHSGQEEVYFFIDGKGLMILGDKEIPVQDGDVILVPDGEFHRVINTTNNSLYFVCVFDGKRYDK